MKRIDSIRLLCLVLLLILCVHSVLIAEPSDGEHVHRLMWFILSVPGAAYLLLSLIISGELSIRRKERCPTG